MDKVTQDEKVIARLSLSAKLEYLPGALSFTRDVISKLGLNDKAVTSLELAVEEASVSVINNSFDPGEEGFFDIIILRRPGQVVVAIEDQGLPFDPKKLEATESDLGVLLMKAFADEIKYVNLGRRGKRVELIKNLPYKPAEDYISDKDKVQDTTPVSDDVPITIRFVKPEDAVNVARCMYRCYGYTYSVDNVYYPEKVKEMIESGLIHAHVCLTPDGEVVGHEATIKEHADSRVGEAGQAIVDPRYRGKGLLNKMGDLLLAHNKKQGMYGYYGEAVTVHPYSQKAVIAHGGTETGALLGYTPATMHFKDIQDEAGKEQRRVAILFYNRINEEPLRDVYPPLHHQSIINSIYQKIGLRRNLVNASNSKQINISLNSQVDIKIQTEASRAFMRIAEYGSDIEELVKFRLHELCLRHIECIYIDLPLSLPGVQVSCASLEMLGFFFGGEREIFCDYNT
ncbi:MAG: ATP-binding protein [Chloroflexi bacterium]|nr:ATP-binding protein [Chloroflexota bacterium]